MPSCELCGNSGLLLRANVEHSILQVCKKCASYGQIIGPVQRSTALFVKKKYVEKEEIQEFVVQNYNHLLKQAREKTGMNQKDFGQKVNIKESIIHKIESGKFEPPLSMAKKLGKLLKIKLVEQQSRENTKTVKSIKTKSEGMTIGDMLKL